MARIFVAHQEQGAQSPLAGLADAVKEQRMMQEEQRRYDQQVVQEQQKLAIADKQMRYQRQRDQIEDRFRSQEIQIRRADVEGRAEAARLRAGSYKSALEQQAAEEAEAAELEAAELERMQFGAASQVQDRFREWSEIPVDQRMPQDYIDSRQAEYEEVLSQLAGAPNRGSAKVSAETLGAMLSEDDERLKEHKANRTLQRLTNRRDQLQEELLDPETLAIYGIDQEDILSRVQGTLDQKELEKQIDALEDLKSYGEESARLNERLDSIRSGKDTSELGKAMQGNLSRVREDIRAYEEEVRGAGADAAEWGEGAWIKNYPDWLGKDGNLKRMTNPDTPIKERNKLMRDWLGIIRLESDPDPDLRSVRDAQIKATRERDMARADLAETSTLLGAVTQATLPGVDTIKRNLGVIEGSYELRPEVRDLARELLYVMMTDDEMAEGVAGKDSLTSALEQIKANRPTPISPEDAREVFALVQSMGDNGQLTATPGEAPQETGGRVLDLPPQVNPLGGTAGKGVAADFSLAEELPQ
jgi:hypothetical protein